jgi:hypothetical protein
MAGLRKNLDDLINNGKTYEFGPGPKINGLNRFTLYPGGSPPLLPKSDSLTNAQAEVTKLAEDLEFELANNFSYDKQLQNSILASIEQINILNENYDQTYKIAKEAGSVSVDINKLTTAQIMDPNITHLWPGKTFFKLNYLLSNTDLKLYDKYVIEMLAMAPQSVAHELIEENSYWDINELDTKSTYEVNQVNTKDFIESVWEGSTIIRVFDEDALLNLETETSIDSVKTSVDEDIKNIDSNN